MGRNGVYHTLGLVKFAAYKFRKDEPGRIQVLTYALPTTYSKSMAKNELFFIVYKDHATQQSKELIVSLLIYWSKLHYELNVIARTNIYQTIYLKDYLFWGKTVIHSTIFSTQQFEKVRNYKNFVRLHGLY